LFDERRLGHNQIIETPPTGRWHFFWVGDGWRDGSL
jgi:hypothetical protein